MKTFLKITLGILAILIIAMFIIGKKYHFEKSIVINAPIEKVWGNVNSSKAFNQWNPWMKLDPNLKLTYTGNQGEIGDQYCWEGNDEVGQGCHEITSIVPNQKVGSKMMFKKPFESDASSDVVLSKEGNGTKVTWSMDCELDYPMNLMGFFISGEMDKSYGSGLNALKAISER